jgi:hypothetical protein
VPVRLANADLTTERCVFLAESFGEFLGEDGQVPSLRVRVPAQDDVAASRGCCENVVLDEVSAISCQRKQFTHMQHLARPVHIGVHTLED